MKNDIKKFLINILLFICIIIVLFTILMLVIIQMSKGQFKSSYQYAINLKYNNLKETNEPKIIVVGGSSAAFGIDSNIIEQKTNMKVVNMGLHANFGMKFQTDIVKANINKDDIVLLAYEYNNYKDINRFDAEMVVTGIDNNLEIYKYVPKEKILDVIKYFPTYTFKKIEAKKEWNIANNVYNIQSFDEKGNMIYDREKCVLPDEITNNYGLIEIHEINITDELKEYLNDFNKYVKEKGGTVLLTFPSIIGERFYGSEEEIKKFEKQIDDLLNVQRISNIKDYVFPREYMYDTIYHCNTKGEKVRSEKLANDIKNYLNNMEV